MNGNGGIFFWLQGLLIPSPFDTRKILPPFTTIEGVNHLKKGVKS